MRDLAVFGLVSPKGLGDALQNSVMVNVLNDLSPESNVTLVCPNLRESLFVFENIA